MKTLKILFLSLFVGLFAFACEEDIVVPSNGTPSVIQEQETELSPEELQAFYTEQYGS